MELNGAHPHGSIAKCAFIIFLMTACLENSLTIGTDFSHKLSICQGVQKGQCNILRTFLYLEWPSSKQKKRKELWKLWVMQNFFVLRYLCSSCCKRFPETGDKNLLILTFLTNLALERKYGDPGTKCLNTTGPDTFGWDRTTRMRNSSFLCTPCHQKSRSHPTVFLRCGQLTFSKASDTLGWWVLSYLSKMCG